MSTDLTLSKLAGPLIKVAISLAKMFQKLMKEFKNYGFKKIWLQINTWFWNKNYKNFK